MAGAVMTYSEFEREVVRLRPVLLHLATTITGNADDAADVVQDALLKLWFMRERLPQYSCIDAPARVIVRNQSINLLRTRHICADSSVELLEVPCEESDREISDEISQLISSLPSTEQAVLRLKHLEGLETEEIARLIQSNPGAVRTALCRARRHIRELYKRTL